MGSFYKKAAKIVKSDYKKLWSKLADSGEISQDVFDWLCAMLDAELKAYVKQNDKSFSERAKEIGGQVAGVILATATAGPAGMFSTGAGIAIASKAGFKTSDKLYEAFKKEPKKTARALKQAMAESPQQASELQQASTGWIFGIILILFVLGGLFGKTKKGL